MPDLSDLIGVRFLVHGRDKSRGYDCYGLAIEVSLRFGHILPDLWYKRSDSATFNNNAEGVLSTLAESVVETEIEEEGNLVVFFEGNKMTHIGVILDEDTFIHCDKFGVRIMRLSEYYRQKRRIYRWV